MPKPSNLTDADRAWLVDVLRECIAKDYMGAADEILKGRVDRIIQEMMPTFEPQIVRAATDAAHSAVMNMVTRQFKVLVEEVRDDS